MSEPVAMIPNTRAILAICAAINGCIFAVPATRADMDVPACFAAPNQECLLREAGDAASAITDLTERVIAIADIAFQEQLHGHPAVARDHFKTALSISREISWPEARLAALTHIANRQIDAAPNLGADRTLKDAQSLIFGQIAAGDSSDVGPWLYRLREVAAQQARLGDANAAMESYGIANTATSKIVDPLARFSEWVLTAFSQIETGDKGGAAATLALAARDAQLLAEADQRVGALLGVAAQQRVLGLRDSAWKTAEAALVNYRQLDESDNRAGFTVGIALLMLELAEK